MLVALQTTPRGDTWGSRTLLADLEGRPPASAPESEVWFGDHPARPAAVDDGTGRTLDRWLADEAARVGAPHRLPYLLKLLAADSPLSIQVHPSKDAAAEGFAREEAAGIARDAPQRTYRDANHKPELIVAVSDQFDALVGLRDLGETRRLLAALGDRPGVRRLADRLGDGDRDPREALRDTIAWVLAGDERDVVADVVAALAAAPEGAFAPEVEAARRIAHLFPGDPGVVVALLMNLVSLRRGAALFLPAGVLHAYLSGLGVELMAASDNVVRGGLTVKHVDVDELMRVLDPTPGPVPPLEPTTIGPGVEQFAPADVTDFALLRVTVADGAARRVDVTSPAIALGTAGRVAVHDGSDERELDPGQAVLAVGVQSLMITGTGTAYIASPAAPANDNGIHAARREGSTAR